MATFSVTMETESWDSLRKEARNLENEIDAKLVALSKVGTNFNQHARSYRSPDKEPLLNSRCMSCLSLGARQLQKKHSLIDFARLLAG